MKSEAEITQVREKLIVAMNTPTDDENLHRTIGLLIVALDWVLNLKNPASDITDQMFALASRIKIPTH